MEGADPNHPNPGWPGLPEHRGHPGIGNGPEVLRGAGGPLRFQTRLGSGLRGCHRLGHILCDLAAAGQGPAQKGTPGADPPGLLRWGGSPGRALDPLQRPLGQPGPGLALVQDQRDPRDPTLPVAGSGGHQRDPVLQLLEGDRPGVPGPVGPVGPVSRGVPAGRLDR